MSRTISSFSLKPLVVAASMVLTANVAWAAEPFVIRDIKVEGLQRVDAGTVFASIPMKVGDTYNDEQGAAAIRALFDLGLFQDVRIDVRGSDMVVMVQERPTISTVDVKPGTDINKETLMGALTRLGVSAGRPYDKAVEARAIQELLRQYQDRGFYGAEITPTVTPIDRNRVNVLFTVNEGYKSRIKDIRFVGNQAFSNSALQNEMELNTGNWMSWYTKSDVYTERKLNTDLEAVRKFYHDRGYIEFQVDSVQTIISPDKKNMSVIVHVTEGPRYVVSKVSMDGNYLGKEEEFQSLIAIKPGAPYKLDDVQASIDAMQKRFGTYGHAFARVEARPRIDRETQQVELIMVADPGQRAYIRRIHVTGNTKTRDEVIRREMRQYEAAWFDPEKVRLSHERLERLGYFTDVSIDTQPVDGSSDQADIVVAVKERPTGSIQLGASYSSTDRLGFQFGLSQENIFGSGQSFALNINTGKYDRTYSISSTDPYFTTSGISRTFYASHSMSEPRPGQGSGDYRVRSDNAGVSFGLPVSEHDTVNFGIGVERYSIKKNTSELPRSYQSYVDYYGASAVGVPISVGWARDNRNSALAPTSGAFQRANAVVSPAGDMRYGMATYKYQHYFPLTRSLTFMFNTDLGYGRGMSCRKDAASELSHNCFPFYKNFFAGGAGSVRGFDYGGIGAQETYMGSSYSVGGNKMFNVNLEVISPLPGANNDKTLRVFAFLDAGNVYVDRIYDEKIGGYRRPTSEEKSIRASAGVGLRWISPLGPLSLSYGHPFRKQPGDKLQKFQFQMGTTF